MDIMDEVKLRSLFGKNIKRFRRMKGWSQEVLAEKMDISKNYLSDIETEKGWVSPNSLIKMANALDIDVFELFKPQETLPKDKKTIVNRCLEDFSTSIKESLDKAIRDSIRKINKDIGTSKNSTKS